MKPSVAKTALILVIAVVSVSTAAIFVRLALADAERADTGFCLFLSASRLILASLFLWPLDLRRREAVPAERSVSRAEGGEPGRSYAIWAGVCLAIHFGLWITSLAFTSIVASTTLVTTNPVWVVVISWLIFHERPHRLVLVGVSIAVCGGLLIGLGGDQGASGGQNPILGDGLALGGAVAMSMYLILGREAQKKGMAIRRYVLLVYTTAAILLLPLPWFFSAGYTGYPAEVYFWVFCMALIPQLIGHTSINWSVRWVSPTIVALVILFEPLLSGLLGYLVFGEFPGAFVWVGASILLAGVAMATWWSQDRDLSPTGGSSLMNEVGADRNQSLTD